MGQTAENVAELENISRVEMDEFGALSQNRAVANVENGFFEREITPVTLPDGSVVGQGRRPAPGHDRREARSAQAGVPSGRAGNRRQRLSAERRRRRRVGDERPAGRRARPPPAGPHRVERGQRPRPRDHGPRAGRGEPAGAEARRHDDRRRRPRGDQRGVRGPGAPFGPSTRRSRSTSSTSTAERSLSATRSG